MWPKAVGIPLAVRVPQEALHFTGQVSQVSWFFLLRPHQDPAQGSAVGGWGLEALLHFR